MKTENNKLMWCVFRGSDILVSKRHDESQPLPSGSEPPAGFEPIGPVMDVAPLQGGIAIKAFEVAAATEGNEQWEFVGLRQSYYVLPHTIYLAAGKARELIYWESHNRYCGSCGHELAKMTAISKRCPACGREVWPLLATAIIVLVHRGDEVLLVTARNFRSDFYGLVAGFVETGETLEEAVHREVREETGIEIANLRYFGSQPWPYPCGLMVGFNADYVSGNLCLQEEELSRGAWFRKDNLPTIPEKLSIARQLIDHWLG